MKLLHAHLSSEDRVIWDQLNALIWPCSVKSIIGDDATFRDQVTGWGLKHGDKPIVEI